MIICQTINLQFRASANHDIWMVQTLLKLGRRLPVNGKGQDVFTAAADKDYDWIYKKLLQKVLQGFAGPGFVFDLGCSPFQGAKPTIHLADICWLSRKYFVACQTNFSLH